MPEIVEVRRYADMIRRVTKRQSLQAVKILGGRYKKHGAPQRFKNLQQILPTTVSSVTTQGKALIIKLGRPDFNIFVTLGLTGGWFYKDKRTGRLCHGLNAKMFEAAYGRSIVNRFMERAQKHICVEFEFRNGSLMFYDQLSYGTISVLRDSDLVKRLRQKGPGAMDVTLKEFRERLTMRSSLQEKRIGNVLMNQSFVSGIGNYLRADILWMSRVSPFRLVKSLTRTEVTRIFKSMMALTWGSYNKKQAIKLGFVVQKRRVLPADYGRAFFVYDSESDVMGRKVKSEPLYEGSQVRYIYWVPGYQK